MRVFGTNREIAMLRSLMAVMLVLAAIACSTANEESPVVVFDTSVGAISFELYADQAPVSVANFLSYVESGAYDGATIYRTTHADNDRSISVIQGGLWRPFEADGDEDFEAPYPPITHETTEETGLSNVAGTLAMARVEPGTAASEFFINVEDNLDLDFGGDRNPDGQGYAVFGRVTDGMSVVTAINKSATKTGEGFAGQILLEPVVISRAYRVER